MKSTPVSRKESASPLASLDVVSELLLRVAIIEQLDDEHTALLWAAVAECDGIRTRLAGGEPV